MFGGFKERVATVKAPQTVETTPVEIGEQRRGTQVGVRTGLHRVPDSQEEVDNTVHRIDRFLRQKMVLSDLSEDSVLGVESKAERVAFAAREGLLPSSFSSSNVVQRGELKSGGLMSDWNFEL